ncbi:MAG: HNH endonuclease family protein, partial [Haliscomenobacter sp.]
YGGKLMQLDLPQNTVGLKPSEKKLIEAYKYFLKQFSEQFKNESTQSVTEFILSKIDLKLFFTSITVKDDLNAFKVFETLNARGVKLSTADLLKNFLFSIIYTPNAGSITQEEKKWHRINDILGKTDVTTYLRHFWNARYYPGERKSTLFKTIKNAVQEQSDAIHLLNDLDNSVSIYVALETPQSEIWTSEQSQMIEDLNILGVSQCYPLLMMAKTRWTEAEFNKLLRNIITISFRYHTIGGQNPNELERIYGKASASIFKGEIKSARVLFNTFLKEAYLDDDSFKNDFSHKIINTQKYNGLVKYILGKLEVQYGGNEPDLDSKQLSVEHILPESPTEEWALNFQGVDIDQYVYRIGNFTLLEANKNREADRKNFDEKKLIYQSSNYRLSAETIPSEYWTPKHVLARQRELANQALAIWKINYQ